MLFLQASQEEITKEMEAHFEKLADNVGEWFNLLFNDPTMALQQLGGKTLHWVILFVTAIAVFFIGRWLIRKFLKTIQRMFEKRKVDTSVSIFVLSLLKVVLYIALFLTVISILGLKITSFVAILAAAGFAIGMALSGTLQNFAGGVMILLLKPYRIGDYISAQGQEGTVKSIQLFNTILTTTDNRTIILPNGPVSTGIIMNTSAQETRCVEWVVGINYGDDFDIAQKVIREILNKDPRILRQPDYTIEIKQLADSSVNIVIRVWVNSADFWDVYFDINARLYKVLPEKGINFPFPQMDIHITK